MILCLGPTPCYQRTMTFERLSLDAVNRTPSVREFASGKSTNVARVLHTLGERPRAISFIGGLRGAAFRDDLVRSGIEHDLIEVEPQTRMAITLVDRENGTATELVEESRELRESDYDAMLAALKMHLATATGLVISGTLPPMAPEDFYARCVKLAGSNLPVIVDAVGEPLLAALEHRPWVVKPNRSELGRTLGRDIATGDDLNSSMSELIRRGAQWVIVTDGSRPTTVTNGQSFWEVVTPPVKVVSTIGSGDAFAAGLAREIPSGGILPNACITAASCAAANAMTPDAGHLNRFDIPPVLSQVEVRQI